MSKIRDFILTSMLACSCIISANAEELDGRYLFVATPGIRNYLEYGGHGLLVFDMNDNFRFVKRIPYQGFGPDGKPSNVKGIAASVPLKRVFITTLQSMMAVDLITEELLWEKNYEGGCDRLAISPDGKTIYLPSLEQDHWHVVDGATGEVIGKIDPKSGAHNTIYSRDGKWIFCAGLKSPFLTVASSGKHQIDHTVGPFTNSIRPFTVNGSGTLVFACVNDLLGFEVGDLTKRTKLATIEVQGFSKGPVKRHGCPCHGIGMTPDESQIWLCDAANQSLHVFGFKVSETGAGEKRIDAKKIDSVKLRDEPGWVTFSLDGKYAFPSTGEIIDVGTRKVVHSLVDETKQNVASEKMVEIHFRNGQPIGAGDQFGIGRKE